MRRQVLASPQHQSLFAATMLWLCGGGFLLITTLVPAHTVLLGWTPTFWLLAAPLMVLLALEPQLPRQLLRRRRPHRLHGVHGVVWH
ncbi:MAG: hypothetical protein EPN69_08205 [Rhodanobacter sp.]|nr:MAG: hypothetical protein EPN69_08205 [Rhodanobacter sp.]TAM04698.1 MAG: hypothetical protein EPN71_02475 [Rhodanobacter sp.]TAM40625.1 MAG: hypothetical protein EPN58_09740 [Rhodanobacter sp.]TAN25542.1 MAG: hypothetical protein EPN32_09375 [Rhodanobacter sp.]